MTSAEVFSLEGKGLKLDTAADAEPHIKALRDNNAVEEIRLGGNTLGVEACEALAKVLKTKKSLQVQFSPSPSIAQDLPRALSRRWLRHSRR